MTHIAWYGRSGRAFVAAILIGAIGMLGGKTAEAEPVKGGSELETLNTMPHITGLGTYLAALEGFGGGSELEALSATPHITGLGAYLAGLEGFSSPQALCSVPTDDITVCTVGLK